MTNLCSWNSQCKGDIVFFVVDMSEDIEEARSNARKNILQALGSSRALSPTLPSHSPFSNDSAADEKQASKDVPLEAKSHSSPQPPSPKPRSPRLSPTNGFVIIDLHCSLHGNIGGLVFCTPRSPQI